MSQTYSTSQGVTLATKLVDFQAVLNILPDNSQKLIAPKDVRDSIFTLWENIAFKPTTVSTSLIEYVGIDKVDSQQKVFFGRKTVGGQEIMNDSLLNEDVDFYFHNNKNDLQTLTNTKIGFLAGTGSYYYESNLAIPYIEAESISTLFTENYINLNIRNTSYIWDGNDRIGGDINILSDKGYISLNNFFFPKQTQNLDASNDGKYLKFIWDGSGYGYGTWSSIESSSINEIVSAGTVSITGSPILFNGKDVNFTDDTPVPSKIGGIEVGDTFDNMPVTEVLRRILYPYLTPSITKSYFDLPIIESGNTTDRDLQKLNFEINRPGTYSITQFSLVESNYFSGSPLLPAPSTIPQGLTSGFVRPQFNVDLPLTKSSATQSWTLTLVDGYGTTKIAYPSFKIVLPWFYGTSTTATFNLTTLNNTVLGSLTKVLKADSLPSESYRITVSTTNLPGGQGCVYFGYPSTYKEIDKIYDSSGFDVTTGFKPYLITGITSPSGYWGGPSQQRQYRFYIFVGTTDSPIVTTLPVGSIYTIIFKT